MLGVVFEKRITWKMGKDVEFSLKTAIRCIHGVEDVLFVMMKTDPVIRKDRIRRLSFLSIFYDDNLDACLSQL